MLLFVASGNIWIGTILIAIVGMTIVAGAITAQTLIQNSVDQNIRARIISITAVLAWGLPAIGAAAMGWVAEFLGLSTTLVIGAGLTALLWLWGHSAGVRLAPMLEKGPVAEAEAAARGTVTHYADATAVPSAPWCWRARARANHPH